MTSDMFGPLGEGQISPFDTGSAPGKGIPLSEGHSHPVKQNKPLDTLCFKSASYWQKRGVIAATHIQLPSNWQSGLGGLVVKEGVPI